MVGLAGGVLNGGKNIFPFQKRVVREDIVVGSSRRQQIEDIRDTDAKAADAWASAALALFNRDPLQPLGAHWNKVYAITCLIANRSVLVTLARAR